MDSQVIEFLAKNRVSVLTTLLLDGSPHSATLHYSHIDEPLKFFFSTEKTSRKCKGLLDGKKVKASMVVGFSEEEWITLQMDGVVKAIIDLNELRKIHKIHYAKHPNSEKYKDDSATIFLKFAPKWWRYTDYNTNPITIISSETK